MWVSMYFISRNVLSTLWHVSFERRAAISFYFVFMKNVFFLSSILPNFGIESDIRQRIRESRIFSILCSCVSLSQSCSDTVGKRGELQRERNWYEKKNLRKSERERERKSTRRIWISVRKSSTFSNIVNKTSGRRVFFLGMLVDQAAGTLIS